MDAIKLIIGGDASGLEKELKKLKGNVEQLKISESVNFNLNPTASANYKKERIETEKKIGLLENDIAARASYSSLQLRKSASKIAQDIEVKSATEAQIKKDDILAKGYSRQVAMGGAARRVAKADAKVESATGAYLGAYAPGLGQTKIDLKAERDELARAIRERRKMGRYGGPRHAGGFGGASSAMFVSVARDSLASLASGANPMTVFLQQAPQVGQAFTMMSRSALSFFKTLLMNPLTWMIAGLAAVGSALAFLVMHFNAVAQGLLNLKNATDFSNRSFVDQLSIIKSLVAAQREHVDWLRKQAEAEAEVATAAEAAVDALKKKQELEMAKARKNGGSTDALEKKQAEEMLAALKAVQTEREAALESAKQKERDDNEANENFIGGTGVDTKSQMNEAEKAESLAAILADKAKAQMLNAYVGTGEFEHMGQYRYEKMRKANESDILNIEHEGKTYPVSLNSAKEMGVTARAEKQRLEELGRGLDQGADEARKKADIATKAKKDADKDVAAQEHAVNLAEIGGPTAKGGGGTGLTENQRVGAYSGGPQMTMIDLQKRHLTVAQQQLALMKSAGGNVRGVSFGGRR